MLFTPSRLLPDISMTEWVPASPSFEQLLGFSTVSGLIFLVGVAAYAALKWRRWF